MDNVHDVSLFCPGANKLYLIKQNLYTNTLLDGFVILFVRYRNHLPVAQFQNQARIRNPHETGQVFKTIIFFLYYIIVLYLGRRHLKIFFSFTAVEGTTPRRAREIPLKAGVSRVII